MFAVVKTGGKQYKVAENDIVVVEKLVGAAGDIVELTDVLMVGDGDKSEIGVPNVEGATVAAQVVEQSRADKIIVFKKKRRKDYRRTRGHRQHQTVLRITEILTGGKKPSKAKAAAKKPARTKAKAAPKPDIKAPAKKPAAKKAAKSETKS